MGPILLHGNAWLQITQPMLQKMDELGYKVLPHLPYSPNLLPTDYHFFKHLNNFLRGKRFPNQQEAENASQQFIDFWSTDFYTTGINLFLIGKNVLIVMVPILINKDVFEPSYNGLKFTIWNHSYFCTNLIELTKKDVFFIEGVWNAKVGSQEIPGIIDKFGFGVQNEAGQRLIEFCQENMLVIANTLFQLHKRWLYTWISPDGQYQN